MGYYNVMDDADREKIDIVLINGYDGKDFEANLRNRNQRLPIQQDDPSETLFKSISNNDPSPKDDMALFDKEGRLVKYFEMQESYMGNTNKNLVRSTIEAVAGADYVNPCASAGSGAGDAKGDDGSKPADKGDKKDEGDKAEKGDKKGKKQVEVVSRDVLVEMCKESETSCAARSGRFKKGACMMKKKLNCRSFKTPELCQASGCKYKKANVKKNKPMKCKGKLPQ